LSADLSPFRGKQWRFVTYPLCDLRFDDLLDDFFRLPVEGTKVFDKRKKATEHLPA